MTESGRNVTNDDDFLIYDGNAAWRPAAWHALVDGLVSLRPWADTDAVSHALAAWTRDHSSPTLDALDVYDVAEHLARIGGARNVPEPQDMASIVLFMLGNVAAGREVDDYGTGFEHIEVTDGGMRFDPLAGQVARGRILSERTVRDYRRRFGPGAFHEWMRALQRRLDRAALVARGRSPAAARAWVRRHQQGEHARDAGPPRRPRV